ncbi:hypothetical protein NM688_g5403 [Phlebia brevispora]|uniref:Uncharacterized protein n=1 Tax=Phlebia brevispora TaxID=194682 RepID=A0ACC1SVR9_9APHY|nr:hypothetical protein NM688_g5403 [Phlebia brevispora]
MRPLMNAYGLPTIIFTICAWLVDTRLAEAQDIGTLCTDSTLMDCLFILNSDFDLCVDLIPDFPSAGAFLAGNPGTTCNLFTSTGCQGNVWAVSTNVEDFSQVNFDGFTPKNNIQSYFCSSGPATTVPGDIPRIEKYNLISMRMEILNRAGYKWMASAVQRHTGNIFIREVGSIGQQMCRIDIKESMHNQPGKVHSSLASSTLLNAMKVPVLAVGLFSLLTLILPVGAQTVIATVCSAPVIVDCISFQANVAGECINMLDDDGVPLLTNSQVGAFFPVAPGFCNLYSGPDCGGDEWILGTTISDFSKLSFDGATALNNVMSFRCFTS